MALEQAIKLNSVNLTKLQETMLDVSKECNNERYRKFLEGLERQVSATFTCIVNHAYVAC